MAVPKQVASQADVARQLQEGLTAPTEPKGGDEGDPQDPPAPAPPSDPPQKKTPADYEWQHKYRTLQGMFNTTVGKLQQDLAALKADNETLKKATSTPPPQQPAPPAAAKYVTENDEAEFGAETIDLIRRAAREEFAGQVEAERARVNQLEQQLQALKADFVPRMEQVASSQKMSAEQLFWRELAATAPDWNTINDDPKFHDWLLEVDPLTGSTRQQHLDAAQGKLDVQRVSNFFTMWKQLSAPPPPPPKNTAKAELEKQIAPGRGRSTEPTTQEPRMFTGAEVAQFYRDVSSGKFEGREQEKAAIERDIFLAGQEGRIT